MDLPFGDIAGDFKRALDAINEKERLRIAEQQRMYDDLALIIIKANTKDDDGGTKTLVGV